MENNAIIEKVVELSGICSQIAKLTDRKKELEAFFARQGSEDIEDTKFKTVSYADPESQAAVTYTEAQKMTVSAPEYLRAALGENTFNDLFTVEHKEEIKPKSKEIERMLIGVFGSNFIKEMPHDVIGKLPCDDKAKQVLARKLKGANFETDRDNLMRIGGFSKEDASDYAYIYAEAVVYRTLWTVCEMSGETEETLIRSIQLAVAVSDSTKIAVT